MNATSTFNLEARPASVSRRPASKGWQPASKIQLRLTRRGRLVLMGIPLMLSAIAVLLLAGFITSPAQASTGANSPGVHASKVTVMAGQTLWSIASASDPSRDPRDVVADILELNSLTTSVVQPGQQVYVPLLN
ncbi:LysM peptidoglycan-binding domain-containing protein [Arthrobacter sp. A5]|uniref:LysM peptidoglycan-binding domain-containing protein n=1 Tax=Arthrobacter sp. A5 TaxID=576926 RepID=UPI003DA82CF0